jgi:hypothetical protein
VRPFSIPSFRIPSFRAKRLLVALAATVVAAACIDRATGVENNDIRRYISGVLLLDGTTAIFNAGEVPSATDGPVLTANVPAIVLKGGTAKINFSAASEFSHIVVAVDGVPGFFDLTLDGPTTSVDVLIVYAQDTGAPAFWMEWAAGDGAANGPFASANTAFLGNATGTVQVNVTWDTKADVDLYVVDPRGNEIYYNARGPLQGTGSGDIPGGNTDPLTSGTSNASASTRNSGTSGGVLDIDSNAGCASDGPRAENIVWPTRVVPPKGEYTVRVNYWSSCGVEATDYVVTIRIKGGLPTTYTGRFTGAGVGGANGAGKRITGFNF